MKAITGFTAWGILTFLDLVLHWAQLSVFTRSCHVGGIVAAYTLVRLLCRGQRGPFG